MSDTHRCGESSNVICDSFSDKTNHNKINYDDLNRQTEKMHERIKELEKALRSICSEAMTVCGHPDFAFDGQINSMYEVALEALKVLKN